MSSTGLEVFDETLHKTNVWLKEIAQVLGPDRHRAYHALRAVLHCLRDRLTVDEATQLATSCRCLSVASITRHGTLPESRRRSGRAKNSSPRSTRTFRRPDPSTPRMQPAPCSRSSRNMSLQARSAM